MQDLGALGGGFSVATAINAAVQVVGQAVGQYTAEAGSAHGTPALASQRDLPGRDAQVRAQ